jgi:hypothetical protein
MTLATTFVVANVDAINVCGSAGPGPRIQRRDVERRGAAAVFIRLRCLAPRDGERAIDRDRGRVLDRSDATIVGGRVLCRRSMRECADCDHRSNGKPRTRQSAYASEKVAEECPHEARRCLSAGGTGSDAAAFKGGECGQPSMSCWKSGVRRRASAFGSASARAGRAIICRITCTPATSASRIAARSPACAPCSASVIVLR